MPTVFQNWGDPLQNAPTGRVLFYVPQERPSTLTAGKVVTTKVVEVPLDAGGFSVTLEPGALQYKVLIDGAPSYRGVLVVPEEVGPHRLFDLRSDYIEFDPPVVGAAQAAAAEAAESAAVAVAAALAAESGAAPTSAAVAPLVSTAGPTRSAVDARVLAVGNGSYAPVSRAAKNPDEIAVGAITRSANGAATGFSVVWDDGATGVFVGTESTTTPGAIDSYTVTHVLGGVTTTYTQPALTRDANGAVTARPAMTVS